MKRLFDILVSAGALLLFSPVIAAVAIAVRLNMGSPVLFRHRRPGLNGRPFVMLKFRTMRERAGADGEPLPDSERLTRLGTFLRSTSLDELPELLNVLKGEMSLVGPRPLLMEYLERYDDFQARRHEVKPGMTGWAQVNGRNAITWEEKFRHDVWYVDNRSVWLDLRIIVMTIGKVLRRSGVSAQGEATMPVFQGSHRKEDK